MQVSGLPTVFFMQCLHPEREPASVPLFHEPQLAAHISRGDHVDSLLAVDARGKLRLLLVREISQAGEILHYKLP